MVRAQGTYLDDDEINALVDEVSTDKVQFDQELIELKVSAEDTPDADRLRSRDELYESAIEIVVRERRGSLSLLQRTLGIGYGRAARLIDFMAEDGFVGEYNGSKSREVLLTMEEWEAIQVGDGSDEDPAGPSGSEPAAAKRRLPFKRSKRPSPPARRGTSPLASVVDEAPESSVAVVAAGHRIEAPPEAILEQDIWEEEVVEEFEEYETAEFTDDEPEAEADEDDRLTAADEFDDEQQAMAQNGRLEEEEDWDDDD